MLEVVVVLLLLFFPVMMLQQELQVGAGPGNRPLVLLCLL